MAIETPTHKFEVIKTEGDKVSVQVQPKNVPAGNLGGAGVVQTISKADWEQLQTAIANANLQGPSADVFSKKPA